jgi:hypothetical protein
MPELCKNCGHPATGRFCSQCGQKTEIVRFTMGHLIHEFIHGFYHVDHGLLYTAKELALRPGITIRNYLAGKRKPYFNPFTFILILGGINALLLKKLHWQNLFIELGLLDPNAVNQEIWNSSLEHFTIRLLLGIPVYALVTYCFYSKNKNTYAEHAIANTFLRGEMNLFMIVLEPLVFISHSQFYLLMVKSGVLVLITIYMGWSYSEVFNDRPGKSVLLKGILVAILAVSLEMILMNVVVSGRY